MDTKFTRRALVKGVLAAGALVPSMSFVVPARAAPADLPPLDIKDPTAINLGFINDAGKADVAANPTYAAGQICSNCQQFQGDRSASRGGCVLFAGKSVPAGGWCKVWRKTF